MTYAYSPTTGLLTSLNANIQGSSIPVTYTYQGANQLRSKTVGGVMVRAYNFRYNNDGSKSALPDYINYRDPAGELMCGDNCFYDESGRLTEIRDSTTVNRTDVTPVTIATYGYDRQGQLTAATVGGTNYTYTYDTAGNIQSKKVGGTTKSYTYGNSAWRDLLTAYDGHEISYDGCGNPTRYYNGSTFTWTQGRRLATATVGGTSISYTYDMAGVRSSKTVNGTEYRYTTLSGLVTRQTGGNAAIDFIYDDSNQPLAMKYNGTLYYYILNAQGDVVRIIDGSRNVVASYSYDPWGKIISSSGTLADINPLRYRGYYYDSETGFYYLQSRYYDPELGRFINADSYASTDATGLLSANMFAYCENDPVNNYDDSGRFCVPAALVNGILSAGLAIAGAYVDSTLSGEAINGKALVLDTIVAFALGFVEGGFGTVFVSNSVDIASAVYAFSSTALRGGTLEDSVLSAASAYFEAKIPNSIDKHFGKATTDMIANSIAGTTIQGELQGIMDVVQSMISQIKKNSTTKKKSTKKNNKTKSVVSNSKQIQIHAFGAL